MPEDPQAPGASPMGRTGPAHPGAAFVLAVAVVVLLAVPALPTAAGHPAAPCTGPRAEGCEAVRAGHSVPIPMAPSLGPGWTQLTPATAPSPRTQPAMAYDPQIHAVVLFGGYNVSVAADGDTWTFANNSWTDISSTLPVAPPARWGASMVWDATDGYLVLFGGRGVRAYFQDTWTFNGTAWTNRTQATAPPARSLFQMAYDPLGADVLVEGGAAKDLTTGVFLPVASAWTYDAGTWTNVTSAAPSAYLSRSAGQAAYDPWNGSDLLVGGGDASTFLNYASCTPADPVQTYVNGTWYTEPIALGPQNLSQEMMVDDPAIPGILVFGGYEPGGPAVTNTTACVQSNDTWTRENGVWANLTSAIGAAPSPRYLSGIAYDPDLKEVVLFGGNSVGAYLGDTWAFLPFNLTVVSIGLARAGGSAPFTEHFSATLRGGVTPYLLNWSWGDGSSSIAGPNSTHTYTTVGTFRVTLVATDPSNQTANSTVDVHVVPPVVPSAVVTPVVGDAPLTVRFNGSVQGGQAPYRYLWTFGDGIQSSNWEANHTYLSAGLYSVSFQVTDSYGTVNGTAFSVNVTPTLSVTAHASAVVGVAPLLVNFTTAIGGGRGPDQFLWSFGDGATSTLVDPSHRYDAPGNYAVRVNVTDSVGSVTNATLSVLVASPLALTTTASALVGVAPFAVTLAANATGGVGADSLAWSFGTAGGSASGPTVSFTYETPGDYTVNTTATDTLGDVAHATLQIQVVAPLTAGSLVPIAAGEAPEAVQFALNGPHGGSGPFTFNWSFGDGATVVGTATENHSYRVAGTFQARVTVRDSLAETSSTSVSVEVVGGLALAVGSGFGVISAGTPVNLTVVVTGGRGPFQYVWGGLPDPCVTEDSATLSCIPGAGGTYSISVVVTDSFGRSAQENASLVVTAPAPSTPVGTSGPGFLPWVLGAGGVAAVALLVGFLAIRRKGLRGGGRPGEAEGTIDRFDDPDAAFPPPASEWPPAQGESPP